MGYVVHFQLFDDMISIPSYRFSQVVDGKISFSLVKVYQETKQFYAPTSYPILNIS